MSTSINTPLGPIGIVIDPITGDVISQADGPHFDAITRYMYDKRQYAAIDAAAADLAKRTDAAWLTGYVRQQELGLRTDPPFYRARPIPGFKHQVVLNPDYTISIYDGSDPKHPTDPVYQLLPAPAPGTVATSQTGTGEVLTPVSDKPTFSIAARTPAEIASALQALLIQAQAVIGAAGGK